MSLSASRTGQPFGLGFTIAAVALIGAGIVLWARYGTLVYFDTLAAGFVGCFI